MSSTASDHKAVVTDLTVRGTAAAKVGTVLAGADSAAGWANTAVYGDGSAKLRVCDNKADGYGVRAYLRAKAGGAVIVQDSDPAFADRCGTITAPAGSLATADVQVCLYAAGVEHDCREQSIS